MNSVRLQDTKLIYGNLMGFYTLTATYQKEKLRKQLQLYQKNKYLGINLGGRKEWYLANSKTLMEETEIDTNKWKNIWCSWIGRMNTVKITILPKKIYRFYAIPNKQIS